MRRTPEIGDTWRRCHNSRGPSRCYPYAAVRAAGPHRSKCVPPHRKHLHTDRFSTPRRTGRAPARPMQARSESNTKGRSCRILRWSPTRGPEATPQGDRKSVVWGKSVSVRVDLGGRRIITKNKINEKKGYN